VMESIDGMFWLSGKCATGVFVEIDSSRGFVVRNGFYDPENDPVFSEDRRRRGTQFTLLDLHALEVFGFGLMRCLECGAWYKQIPPEENCVCPNCGGELSAEG